MKNQLQVPTLKQIEMQILRKERKTAFVHLTEYLRHKRHQEINKVFKDGTYIKQMRYLTRDPLTNQTIVVAIN